MILKPLILVAILGYAIAAPSSKIETSLQKTLETKGIAAVFLNMKIGTKKLLDSVSSRTYNSREEKINTVVQALQQHATTTQKSISDFLNRESIAYQSFWISNQIYIAKASLSLVKQLSEFSEISEIIEEGISYIEKPELVSQVRELPAGAIRETPWGIGKIQADWVWGTVGFTGIGVVVGIIDTGVRGTHQDLRASFRTPYGWRDPSFTNATATPNDQNGHGTHCTGTIVGARGIGGAPGAKWIACKGCTETPEGTACSNSNLILCGEWMLCPTLPDGTQQDCSKAANLVSNSWAGGQGNIFYNPVVDAWKAVNIVPVFGQGNSGPNCSTALSPGDSDVIGVGATDVNDTLANFSSKGPNIFGTLKPDLSAPGVGVYSSHNVSDTAYATFSGTSMATPHVAGAVALILSRNISLTYAEVKQALYFGVETTSLTTCDLACGGIAGNTYPNNCYGRGRLNVYNAVTSIS